MSTWQSLGQHPGGWEAIRYEELQGVQVSGICGCLSLADLLRLQPNFHRALEIDVPISVAGAFAYFVTYSPLPPFGGNSNETADTAETPYYYIDVSPSLTLNGKSLSLNALSIFSVISKFMGKYPDSWEKHLKGIGQRKYNMVHFTPLMQRGASNSPYSLYDQFQFDAETFPNGEEDVKNMVATMEKEHGLLGMTDVVWNHTANNSKWLEAHPEAGYNLETAPWLEAALELDTALLRYSGNLKSLGLPIELKSVDDLLKVMDGVKMHVIGAIKLWEFYVVNVQAGATAAIEAWSKSHVLSEHQGFGGPGAQEARTWSLTQQADFLLENDFAGRHTMGARFGRRTNPQAGATLLAGLFGKYDPSSHGTPTEGVAHNAVVKMLDEVNLQFYREYDADAAEILEQVFNRIKYVRLDDHGPKTGPITQKNPLIESYFTRLPNNATTKRHGPKALALVNNGWVWAADAMRDNAGPDSKAYLRREVIVWGDCVKLRYGTGPADSPYLWDHMSRYTQLMAKYFVGFRIDNCHSTPIAVAEYLLGKARAVRPNLAVFAELFTGSEQTDYTFVKRLGLSALIREAMQAWSTGQLSRLVHRHGGRPIGSFQVDEVSNEDHTKSGASDLGIKAKKIKRSPLHALFMDCTHDNEVPAQKRDARDTLPNAALVNMCNCATGSVMGYDEIYPALVDLVGETRLYTSKSSEQDVTVSGDEGGIGGIKKLLNGIHVEMGNAGFDETHIHHDGEFVTVHRVHPITRKGYFAVAHTAFPGYGAGHGHLSPVNLAGTKAKLIGSWKLEVDASDSTKKRILGEKHYLRGLPSSVLEITGVGVDENPDGTTITIPEHFPPGSIALFETSIPSVEHSDGLDRFVTSEADAAFDQLNLVDLNFVLYRCDAEERDFSAGADGVYSVPGHGALVYAGLQGWWSVLKHVVKDNDLGHPICNHLRDGQWALDYIVGRLDKLVERESLTSLKGPADWLRSRFTAIRKIPSFLLPRYFALVIQTAYHAAWNRALQLLDPHFRNGQPFLQELAMVSVQQTGLMKSASLWPTKRVPSLAAGLPHFSSDWARCWGRDVFISLRGLYLGTGRFDDAREHIMAFASVLKHGMIPNLLSSGKNPRYNSRDSVWFFLQNIQDYTKMVPGGLGLLKEKVKRRFLPYDDTYFDYDDPRAYSKESTIEDIIQEVLQRHAINMEFREANAGPGLDMQMKSEGFDIEIHVDWLTGMIFGGSQSNCGTWMDKMGESERAGSKGVPGTPRDGAAIEITGMLYSTLKWLAELHGNGLYSHSYTEIDPNKNISFADWAALIKKHFERCYYIPTDPKEDGEFVVDPQIVNRRGIYKDLFASGKTFEDYQLRPNFAIAMSVAPELFTTSRALDCLALADKVLRGPMGMATLDPSDMNYRPYYNNSEDSSDFATSKGRNYHQGPEWLWPTGFFLRAMLKFSLQANDTPEGRTEAFQQVTQRIRGCKQAIEESPWAGLTELTNKNGEFCADSVCLREWLEPDRMANLAQSPTQAWSAGTLIDLFTDAKELEELARDDGA